MMTQQRNCALDDSTELQLVEPLLAAYEIVDVIEHGRGGKAAILEGRPHRFERDVAGQENHEGEFDRRPRKSPGLGTLEWPRLNHRNCWSCWPRVHDLAVRTLPRTDQPTKGHQCDSRLAFDAVRYLFYADADMAAAVPMFGFRPSARTGDARLDLLIEVRRALTQ